ncbi:MAG TPA: hypothetical protein VEL31_03600, partial [Ktedonobacteraceae bacterium]|nr:hypothetical protein [Ktedonobacteraceae bacterium]
HSATLIFIRFYGVAELELTSSFDQQDHRPWRLSDLFAERLKTTRDAARGETFPWRHLSIRGKK